MELVSVITPCYRAGATLPGTVRSVLAQTYSRWEMLIISDDGTNYQAALAKAGIHDERLRFVTTGGIATGESHARNTGLEAARGDLIAILDADDFFLPEKLARTLPKAKEHGLVTCALDIVNAAGTSLRFVGDTSIDGILPAHLHKQVNITADSIIVYDRARMDPRYDERLDRLADLEFAWRCYERLDHAWHIATPLHRYTKHAGAMSLLPDTHQKFIAAKRELLRRLSAGAYGFRDALMQEAMQRFLAISIEAEQRFAQNPTALFEDIIEPMLA